MTNLYYTFFYPHLIYGIEFWGHAAQCDLNQIMLLQKAALRVILKIHARNHVTSNFQRLKIMPVSMLFEYQYVLLFLKQVHEEQITPKINKNEKTRSSAKFLPTVPTTAEGNDCCCPRESTCSTATLWGGGGKPFNSADRLAGALWEGGV